MSPLYTQWFEGGRTSLNSGYRNRAGYWLGLNLIRQLRQTYSLQQLASWSPAEAQRRARAPLVDMARGALGERCAASAAAWSAFERGESFAVESFGSEPRFTFFFTAITAAADYAMLAPEVAASAARG